MQKQVDQYSFKLADLIGQGFSSSVYKGRERNDGHLVAVKVIELAKLTNDIEKMLLRNEVKALNLLAHENVMRCEKILQTGKNMYIVSQFCEGGDLAALVKANPLPEAEALRLFLQVARGYLSVFSAGFIHRDLKLSNIFLKNGVPKIGDFGFCDQLQGEKADKFYNVGSPAYMSPEAYFDTKYSEKSDIWALGVLLYELVKGKPLVTKERSIERLQRAGMGFLQAEVGEKCYSVLRQCLQVRVQERINSLNLVKLLESILQEKPTMVHMTSAEPIRPLAVPAKALTKAPSQISFEEVKAKPAGIRPLATLTTLSPLQPISFNNGEKIEGQEGLLKLLDEEARLFNDYKKSNLNFPNKYYKQHVPALLLKLAQAKTKEVSKLAANLGGVAVDLQQHESISSELEGLAPLISDNYLFNKIIEQEDGLQVSQLEKVVKIVLGKSIKDLQNIAGVENMQTAWLKGVCSSILKRDWSAIAEERWASSVAPPSQ